jgi:2-dehydropantoate 2-reductase
MDVNRPHLEAIQKNGLVISGIWGDHAVRGFECYTAVEQIKKKYGCIFISVKSFDTGAAAAQTRPLLKKDTLLVSLQNGIGNVETIAKKAQHPFVLGGRVIFGITMLKPGAVKITVYTQPVVIGFPDMANRILEAAIVQKAASVAKTIDASCIPCEYTEEIEKYLWAKLLYNCALNPLGAIHGVHYGALGENDEWRDTMNVIVKEIFAVAQARHTVLFWDRPEAFLDLFYSKLLPDTYNHRSSMLQDIEKGRPTEIDSLCGMVVKYGREVGVETPQNESMVRRIKAL